MRVLGLTACLAVVSLAGVAPAAAQTPEEERPLPAPVPIADDALTAALETGELSEAEYALERARSLFQLANVRREFGYVARPLGQDATLILRDLAARVGDLAGVERLAAKQILARPSDDPPIVPIGDGWTATESTSSQTCARARRAAYVRSASAAESNSLPMICRTRAPAPALILCRRARKARSRRSESSASRAMRRRSCAGEIRYTRARSTTRAVR